MSEWMTSIRIPGQRLGWGLAEYGKISVDEMVRIYRAYERELRAHADAIAALDDGEFLIEQYCGCFARKNCRVIQQPTTASPKSGGTPHERLSRSP